MNRTVWVVAAVLVIAVAVVFLLQQGVSGGKPGFERILVQKDGHWVMDGWSHQGPGEFTLDSTTGVLTGRGGMGLLWYTPREYGDFVLDLEFRCADTTTNSGVFLRVPGVPTSDDYIYHSFEVQIDDAGEGAIHKTGAVYDAEAPTEVATRPPGQWNHFVITFQRNHITVVLNDRTVVDWNAEPRGKVRDFAQRGYVGLQNHDERGGISFRNIFIKAL
jgi:3-keto-disaccharide hydrolase